MPHVDPEVKKNYFREYYKKNKAKLDAYKSSWISDNPDKHSEHQQKYRESSKQKRQEWQRQYRYGLTNKMFTSMLEQQENSCKLCKKDFETTKIFVDHCHLTGSVRGLLCPSCNTALGLIKDDLLWLSKAKTYLTENT